MSRLLLPVLLLISVFVGSSGAYACIQSPCRGYYRAHAPYYPWQGYSYPRQPLSGPMGGFWTEPWGPIYPTQAWGRFIRPSLGAAAASAEARAA